jgi:hypothetical protein
MKCLFSQFIMNIASKYVSIGAKIMQNSIKFVLYISEINKIQIVRLNAKILSLSKWTKFVS